MSQSEKAVFWIEYVIRNGPDSLRTPAQQYSFWQLILLDIYLFSTLVFLLISSVVVSSLVLILKKFRKSSHGTEKIIVTKKVQ